MELSDRESDGDADVTSPEVSRPRRSARARHVVRETYREENSDNEDDPPLDGDAGVDDRVSSVHIKQEPNEDNDNGMHGVSAQPIDLSAQLSSDEEKMNKPKMQMKLTYEGFAISKYKLCLIVQPYPPLTRTSGPNEATRSESLLPSKQGSILQYTNPARGSSLAPPSGSTSMRDPRSMTPAYQRVPLFREPTPALPEPVETRDLAARDHRAGSRNEEGDAFAVVDDDSLDSLMQLTQSFRERDSSGVGGVGIGGYDGVDFDTNEDGVLGGDAVE